MRVMLTFLLMAGPAAAGILPDTADWQEVPFERVTGKPMIAVTVAGHSGQMLFDNGTPEVLILNRDALALSPGTEVARGHAASGQEIIIEIVDAPAVSVAGHPIELAAKVPTGNFGFTASAFGPDFMGFLGADLVRDHAFLLDYDRQVLTVYRTDPSGLMSVPPPTRADIMARVDFAIWPNEQPTTAAILGTMPILLDFDTGDEGTLYLRPETLDRLLASGDLRQVAENRLILRQLVFGGAAFADIEVAHVEAGGPLDFRQTGPSDWLRLGSDFLARHPVLWNFPGHSLVILHPDSAFLAPR